MLEEGLLVARIDDAAAVDERDLIGDLLHILGVVRGKEDGATLVAQYVHQFDEHLVARDGVEAGGGFIEQQQPRPAREHQQQRRLRALAMGEVPDLLLGAQVEALQQGLSVRCVPARIDGSDEPHVPAERSEAVEAHVLGDVADLPLCGHLLLGHRAPEHAHLSAVLVDQRHQDPDEGRLAGAVRADQTHDLSAWQRQAHIVERKEAIRL